MARPHGLGREIDVGQDPEELAVEGPQLHARQLVADAEVRPEPEAHVRVGVATEIERYGSSNTVGSKLAAGKNM